MQYLKRLVELAVVAFLAAAVPVFTEQGASKAGVSAAVAAGLAAVYGLLVKGLGDKDRPSAL